MKKNLIFFLLLAFFLTSCSLFKKDPIPIKKDNRTQVSFKKLHHYAKLASASYLGKKKIRAVTRDYTNLIIREVPNSEVLYFVAKNHKLKVQVISIRGTSTLENVMLDAKSSSNDDRKLKIRLHAGFQKASREVYRDLIHRTKALRRDYKTVIVGHSLGGAVAVILGAYLFEDQYHIRRIITFGQPKVTSEKGGKKLSYLPLVRVVNRKDMVTLLPPWTPLNILDSDEYYHHGLEILLLGKKMYRHHKVGLIQTEKQSISFWGSLIEGNLNVGEHLIASYIKRIRALRHITINVRFKKNIKWKHRK